MKKKMIAAAIASALLVMLYLMWGRTRLEDLGFVLSVKKDIIISSVVGLGSFLVMISKSLDNDDTLRLSGDKMKALYHPVPPKYLFRKPTGLTIGRCNGKYVCIPFEKSPLHQLVIGAPGDAKTSTLLNGLIVNLNPELYGNKLTLNSTFCIDVKPEMSLKSVYEGRDDVVILNPSKMDSVGFDLWGNMKGKSEDYVYHQIRKIAETLVSDVGRDNAFFSDSATNVLTAFLMYGFFKGLDFSGAILMIKDSSCPDLVSTILEDSDVLSHHSRIARQIKEFDGKSSDAIQDVFSTMKKDLDIFEDETVKHFFSSDNPHRVTPEDLIDGKNMFLAIPDDQLTDFKAVLKLITNITFAQVLSSNKRRRRDKQPIWFLIEEAGSIGCLPMLNDVLERGRDRGIQCTLVIQSEGQLDDTYGKDGKRRIRDCCKTTIVFGSNDDETCESLSKRTGSYHEHTTSISTKSGMIGDSSQNDGEIYRTAVEPADIQSLSARNKVLVFTEGNWFICDKAPYFTIPILNRNSVAIVNQNAKFYNFVDDSQYPRAE